MIKKSYFKLKELKAKEQGKSFWFEATLTDKEANLRVTKSRHTCNFCKMEDKRKCKFGHTIPDILKYTCDEWRYIA